MAAPKGTQERLLTPRRVRGLGHAEYAEGPCERDRDNYIRDAFRSRLELTAINQLYVRTWKSFHYTFLSALKHGTTRILIGVSYHPI